MRGFFGIGIINGKHRANIGTLWRSAYVFGASFIFTIGERYDPKKHGGDTPKTIRHIPLFHYPDFQTFRKSMPKICKLVAVEDIKTGISRPLSGYLHPQNCVYLLGAEDEGIKEHILTQCDAVLSIPTKNCLNVAVAGSIVIYDRIKTLGGNLDEKDISNHTTSYKFSRL